MEEEPVDKPGTTIGRKFSVLHCIRIPFLMKCGFWPLIHPKEYPFSSQSFPSDKTGVSSRTLIVKNTGCFFGIGALVFEKVLSCETRGPILRKRGPIQRNTVSLNRTAHEWAVLFSETVFLWIRPRFFIEKTRVFEHVEQHLNSMFGSLLIATFLLSTNGPRSVITCSRCSTEVTTGSYQFQVWE